MTLFIHYKK